MTRRGRIARASILLVPAAGFLLLSGGRSAHAEAAGAFPNLEPWPETLALGGIPVALGEGVEAVLENPTGMLTNGGNGIAFSHASLFTGGLVKHQTFAVCYARKDEQISWTNGTIYQGHGAVSSAIGIGVTNLSGDLPGSDSYGELQFSLAYARRVPLGMKAGFRIRGLQARTTVNEMGGAGGYAFDFGLENRILGCRVGFVANAVASEVRWDRSIDAPIPTRFAVSFERDAGHGLTTLAGIEMRSSAQLKRVTFAARWLFPGTPLALQAGPSLLSGDGESHAEISAGTTIRVGGLAAEYGMRTGPSGLGEIHRFGIRVALP